MYKNLFFDFDGTLFNGYPRMLCALKKTLKVKRNLEVSYESLFADVMVSFRYLNSKYDITNEEKDYYNELCKNDDSLPEYILFDGAEELLKELYNNGIRCFMYTNRDSSTIDFMKKFDVDKYMLDYIIDAHKPVSGPLDEMIEKYHLNKEECLVVGDRSLDIESAIVSGMDSFYLNSYKEEPRATYSGSEYADLVKLLLGK